jgi:hypothetical protein
LRCAVSGEIEFESAKRSLGIFDLKHINQECEYEIPQFNSSDKVIQAVNRDLKKTRVTRYSMYWNIAVWLSRKAEEGNPLGGSVLEISGTSLLRKYLTKPGTEFTLGDYPEVDVTRLDSTYAAETFDGVIMDSVLEHVANPMLAVLQAWRVLKKGGFLIVVVPSTYPYHWGPWDFWRFTPDSLKVLAAPFASISTCGCYRSQKLIQWISKVYPNVDIYPYTNSHAMKMVEEEPLLRSLTLPDYGQTIAKGKERTTSGDPKYGESIFLSWIIMTK